MKYLLLLACAQRKFQTPGPLPAMERYDGVNYRVLRKLRYENRWPECCDIRIISALHGLIGPEHILGYYDLKMTRPRALYLQSQVSAGLDALLAPRPYAEIFVNLGKTYLLATQSSVELWTEPQCAVRIAAGSIGVKMAAMRQWLLELREREGGD